VFADLNLPHADDLLAKAELAAKIIAEIQRRRLTQSQAAAILGIDQPKVSALKQGKLSGFSIERLMRLLLALGRDIEIVVKTRTKARSAATLRVARLMIWRVAREQSTPVQLPAVDDWLRGHFHATRQRNGLQAKREGLYS
jgi:predicted XRE-type DNA-binding protein